MRKLVVVVLVVALAVGSLMCLSSCGVKPVSSQAITGVPGDNPNQAADPAKKQVCLSNEQAFEQQVAAWTAQNPGATVPSTLATLQSAGVVNAVPTCPNGGTYSWDGSSLTCSVDGHWQ